MKITFFGAVEEVTGSRYLIEQEGTKILVDCGMFQGEAENTERNWDEFPVDPSSIDAVILTHAHIDHSGYLPLFVTKGFKGKIYCSSGTYALCSIVLIDSGNLQEEVARHTVNGPKREPLYTAQDARNSLNFFEVIDYNKVITLGALQVTLIPSYHIIGASFVVVSDGKKTLTFSGDLGRPNQLIMKSPTPIEKTDFLVLESTYGDRLHKEGDSAAVLSSLIQEAVARGGTVLIPSFAVGRTQTILYVLYLLKQKKAIPEVPIFLDSPMAIRTTELFCDFNEEHKLSPSLCKDIFAVATRTPTVKESNKLHNLNGSAIIVAGSGMADGGRMLSHLQYFISDEKNMVIFVGFQAEGTLGHDLVEGAKKINLYGQSYVVRAKIKTIDYFSAHADYNEILQWLGYFKNGPEKVFITHGQPESAQSLKQKIEKRFGWSVVIPKYLDSFDL